MAEETNKIPKDTAEKEINEWLDYKKVGPEKREANKDSIKSLVGAVAEGNLILNEDKSFEQKLKFPIGTESVTDALIYKPRVSMKQIHQNMQGVKTNDADGRLMAYVVTLTGKQKAIIESLDSEDYGICTSIAVFFL